MTIIHLTALLAAVATLWPTAPAQATIYRWVDDTGTVRFSDTPPADAPATVVRTERAPATAIRQTPTDELDDTQPSKSETHADTGKQAGDAPAQPTIDPELAAENCRKARERLTFLQNTPAVRILYETDSGETSRMTPSERDSRIERMQSLAAKFCR